MTDLSPWTIYWALQLDTIGKSLTIILVLLVIALALCTSEASCSYSTEEYKAKAKQLRNILFGFVVLIGMLNIFIPSSKTVAAMFIIPPVVNNEQVQELPKEVLSFIHSILKEYKTKEN